MKILTVVVPTYNMEQFLPRCLDSIISLQMVNDVEILVVNDGSKDNSLKVARAYEVRYPDSVRVIDKKNGNYGSTVNRGIQEATGKYFRILDADDFFNREALVYFMSKLKQTDVDMVVTNYVRQHSSGYSSPIKAIGVDYDYIYDFEEFDVRLRKLYINFVMHGITYRTSILKEQCIKLSEGISYTDTEYCFYPLPYVKRLVFIDCFLYQYQIGREGQTISLEAMKKSTSHMRIIIDRMADWIESNECSLNVIIKNNMLSVYTNILEMYFATYLCWGHTEQKAIDLKELYCRLVRIEGLESLLDTLNIGKVYYMRRFRNGYMCSNSTFFRFYYKSIACSKKVAQKILSYFC